MWQCLRPVATIRFVVSPPSTVVGSPAIWRRAFTSSGLRQAIAARLVGDLEKRISAIPLERFRNFCIVSILWSLAACLLFLCHTMKSFVRKPHLRFYRPRKYALTTSFETGRSCRSWQKYTQRQVARAHRHHCPRREQADP